MNKTNDAYASDVNNSEDIHDVKIYLQQIRSQDFYNARRSDIYNGTGRYAIPSGLRKLIMTADSINSMTDGIYECQDILIERGKDWFLYEEELNVNSLTNDYSLR